LEGPPSSSSRDRQWIEEEAARLVVELSGAGDSDAARARLADWLAQGPLHAVAYARAQATWRAAERLKAAPPPVEPEAVAGPAGRFEAFFIRRQTAITALVLSLVAVLAIVIVQALTSVDRYHTGIGETRTIALPDGSSMRLNTGSTAEVATRAGRRHIKLIDGEAMFDIARDPARLFIVDVPSASLGATGAAFNVRLRHDFVELTMVEGEVSVRAGPDKAAQGVTAGKLAAIRRGVVAESALDPAGLAQRTAWQAGRIDLDGATLAQAIEEFNRYRSTPLVVGDPRIAAVPVSGRFRTSDADLFLRMLQRDHAIRTIAGSDGALMLISSP
jgi:transmembrane sensor